MRRSVVTKLAAMSSAASAYAAFPDETRAEAHARRFDIFVSTPMSAYASDEAAYKYNRSTLLDLFESLKKNSRFSNFFCPAVLFNDLTSFNGELDALAEDFLALEASQAFILYYMPPLPVKPSSVFVEAGMALAARIPSVYIVRSRADLPYMLRGADTFLVDEGASGWRVPAPKADAERAAREPMVKIMELAEGQSPDADEIGRWLEKRIERRTRAGYC